MKNGPQEQISICSMCFHHVVVIEAITAVSVLSCSRALFSLLKRKQHVTLQKQHHVVPSRDIENMETNCGIKVNNSEIAELNKYVKGNKW